jgi:ABC-type protease/lipase transport system fused ATPase/permease subunit
MSSKTKAAKKAAKQAEKRAIARSEEVQDRAAELAERAGTVVHDRAAELAERLRDSDALAKAAKKGEELAGLAKERWEDSELEGRALALAGAAKARWDDAEVEQRVEQLAKQVREADAAKEASKKARDLTDSSLAAVGGWLAASKAADKMGIAPSRRAGLPGIVWVLIGVAVGFVAGRMAAGSSSDDVRDDLAAAAERLATKAPHPAGTVLADTIRTTLQGDPRTAELRQLNINVAEGTVFVRGSIPSGIDSDAVRSVIEGVPGVEDVDLQLSPAI